MPLPICGIFCRTSIMSRMILITLGLLFAIPYGHANNDSWSHAVDLATRAVVSISVDHPRAFDENWNQSTQATGFVVDADRGIVLTNRHVIGPGPSVAYATFNTKEQVTLQPLYRDPVHDFGFYKYNPEQLQHTTPPQLDLVPEQASVGTEIRIVGNDAGEQLSILDGTLARLDRDAPQYGFGRYNDFNTFYLQAASGSSGGSSGSPVVNKAGQVIALNAGARTRAATSYFLPLEPVRYALEMLQANKTPLRGTLFTIFKAQTFAELRKLGLSADTESTYRKYKSVHPGMLTVGQILPGSAAKRVLAEGDILLSVNQRPITGFAELATVLNAQVNQTVEVCVERAGTSPCFALPVADLEAARPKSYLEFDGALLHELSYQQAIHFNRKLGGVYLANPGFSLAQAGVGKGSLITHVDETALENLDQLETQLKTWQPGQQLELRYITLSANRADRFASVEVDLRWFSSHSCDEDSADGVWRCEAIVSPDKTGVVINADGESAGKPGKRQAGIVHVRFNMPFAISGQEAGQNQGVGLIVDPTQGLVVTSRTVVSSPVGNIYLTLNGQVEVPATFLRAHPSYNLVMLQYDPNAFADTPIKPVRWSQRAAGAGDEHTITGVDNEHKPREQQATVAEVEPIQFPISAPPKFQNTNTELLQYVNGPADFTGVIYDRRDRVAGLWQRFVHSSSGRTRTWSRGLPARLVQHFVENDQWFDSGTYWFPISKAQVNRRGLSRLDNPPEFAKLFELTRITAGTEAYTSMRKGDVLFQVNGSTISSLQDISLAAQAPDVTFTVLRNGKVIDVKLQTTPRQGVQTTDLVFWSGAVVQQVPLALPRERQLSQEGVYVSFYRFGSPASRSGLLANMRIVGINDQAITSIPDFINAVEALPDRANVRLRVIDLNDRPRVLKLETNYDYWPNSHLRLKEGEWQRTPLKHRP